MYCPLRYTGHFIMKVFVVKASRQAGRGKTRGTLTWLLSERAPSGRQPGSFSGAACSPSGTPAGKCEAAPSPSLASSGSARHLPGTVRKLSYMHAHDSAVLRTDLLVSELIPELLLAYRHFHVSCSFHRYRQVVMKVDGMIVRSSLLLSYRLVARKSIAWRVLF